MSLTPAAPDGRPAISVGMLGYGFMGKAHSNALKTLPYMFWPDGPQVDLRAIAGRSEVKVSEAATRYGWANYTTDWRDLVNDPEITVFDNVGPDQTHFEPTLAAVKAGKHAICEKPLALTVAEAVELERAAAAAGVKSLTCFNYRFVPAVRLAHDMITNGDLGEIYSATFRYAQDWRTDPTAELGSWAGALSIIGCHAVDQARYLVGEIDSVSALLTNPVTTAERGEPIDTMSALAQLQSGAPVTIAATLVAPGRKNMLGWEINGSKGSLTWDLEHLNLLRVYRRTGGPLDGFADVIVCEENHPLTKAWWPSGHVLGWEHSHINMLAHFLDAVVNDGDIAPHAATFSDGAAAARVAEAITRAAATGTRTTIASVS
ncbi:Gfo/Idh/MocA family oxidoreductase [Cryobacterium glaciale]|uniref:Gfo/Idh/MocA family oxidoreductase n=1 Tax=Cryobacterium glaciale TaxID=1259145 RepID=A0A4R8UXV9_9MICO|nr:Gfo/Idh/MocA family oxidoreductase [Cryobacterium glaciale]TFB74387.1 Gfo/Idh/MocA family oxidoreductase [Cryobacterium glaciale]